MVTGEMSHLLRTLILALSLALAAFLCCGLPLFMARVEDLLSGPNPFFRLGIALGSQKIGHGKSAQDLDYSRPANGLLKNLKPNLRPCKISGTLYFFRTPGSLKQYKLYSLVASGQKLYEFTVVCGCDFFRLHNK